MPWQEAAKWLAEGKVQGSQGTSAAKISPALCPACLGWHDSCASSALLSPLQPGLSLGGPGVGLGEQRGSSTAPLSTVILRLTGSFPVCTVREAGLSSLRDTHFLLHSFICIYHLSGSVLGPWLQRKMTWFLLSICLV